MKTAWKRGLALGFAGIFLHAWGAHAGLRTYVEDTGGRMISGAALSPGDDVFSDASSAGSPASVIPQWTLPQGWSSQPGKGFRQATFTVSASPDLEATLVVLPGEAGSLEANVARWMNQIGVTLLDQELEDFLASAPGLESVDGHRGVIFDFVPLSLSSGQTKTIVAVVFPRDEAKVFLKLTGPTQSVSAEKERFLDLARSFRWSAE